MALGKSVIKGGIAALMVMAMSAGAFAWEAAATTSVNMRSGPGTNFRVVDVLQRNQVVDVDYCRSNWCLVDQGRSGPRGWVSQNYLAQVRGGWQPPRHEPPRWNPRPPRPPHWDHPRPRPPHWGHPRPPRPPHWHNPRPRPTPPNSQVCFNGPNGYFCVGS